MKKLFLLLMVIVITCTITACTFTAKSTIIGKYNNETNEFVIENISSELYRDVEITIVTENDVGNKNKLVFNIGDLESYGKYTINLDNISNISSVYIEEYSYYENVVLPILIYFISCVVLISIIAGIEYLVMRIKKKRKKVTK